MQAGDPQQQQQQQGFPWDLAVQVLGAVAGIGAWIAVVGGARLWARLHAMDVPAAQTVSALPRELLIAEGFRTLLVPLLLGGAIAVLVYLSRKGKTPGETTDGHSTGPDVGVTAAVQSAHGHAVAAREQVEAVDTALKAALDAADAMHHEQPESGKRAEAGEPATQPGQAEADAQADADARDRARQLEESMQHASGLLAGAAAHCEVAATAATEARQRAREVHDPDARISRAAQSLGELKDQLAAAHVDLAAMSQPLRGHGSGTPEQLAAARAVRGPLRDLSRKLSGIGEQAKQAEDALRTGDRAAADEGLARLWAAVRRLAPVDYLGVFVRKLDHDYGRPVAIFLIVALVVAFGAIALVLVRADPLVILGASVFCAGLIAVLIFRELEGPALVAAALALPVIALAGLWSSLTWLYPVAVVLVTVATVWLAAGAMDKWRGAGAVAWILFAAIAFWSGALAFIGELGAQDVRVASAVVKRKSLAGPVQGFYLGRTSKQVFLASAVGCGGDDCRRVMSVGESDVACVVFGPELNVHDPKPIDAVLAEFATVPPSTEPTAVSTPTEDAATKADVCTAPKPTPTPTPEKPQPPAPPPEPNPNPNPHPGPDPSPDPTPDRPRAGLRLALSSDVLFRFGSAEVTAAGRRRLATVAREVRRRKAARVFIAGHTDSEGRWRRNLGLSRRRADNVQRILARSLRDASTVIASDGFGERFPLACNRRPSGADDWIARAYNRRVEIWTGRPPRYPKLRCRR